MPAVNDVGKPCAGEPHARFDGRELETEHNPTTVTAMGQPDGKPQASRLPDLPSQLCHCASSRPSIVIPGKITGGELGVSKLHIGQGSW